jgi:Flp pilus assembly pilin Flp
VLTAFFGYDRWLQMDENGTAAAEYAALPWTRAIIIDIDPF